MLIWILGSKNDLKVSHRKQFNSLSNMKVATSLMNFECHSCGIFEGFLYHQEDESIDPTTFSANVGLVHIIKKLVSSNFIVIVSSASVIFDTRYTYTCYSNKG